VTRSLKRPSRDSCHDGLDLVMPEVRWKRRAYGSHHALNLGAAKPYLLSGMFITLSASQLVRGKDGCRVFWNREGIS
jgi:hypothetical protein